MQVSSNLVDGWQKGCHQNQRLPLIGLSDLRRVYVQIYSFLLKNQVPAYNRDNAVLVLVDIKPQLMPFVDNMNSRVTSPPKSERMIRLKLKSVHAANDGSNKRGLLALGLHNKDWISVATFDLFFLAQHCLRMLPPANTETRTDHRGERCFVEVHKYDIKTASDIIVSRRKSLKHIRWVKHQTRSRGSWKNRATFLLGFFAEIPSVICAQAYGQPSLACVSGLSTSLVLKFTIGTFGCLENLK